MKKEIMIAGPCAAESRQQILDSARGLQEIGINIMRASLWKPRTRPGFEGVGWSGVPWLAEATKLGITVGTEILMPEHVTQVAIDIYADGDPEKILLWLGSRNQNHLLQKEIARTMLGETSPKVKLMIKNQPWKDEAHWLGIVDHITDAGFPAERIILCHRGFAPGEPNSLGLRNPPDWEMAMRVKEITGLPMIIDPSHIGGTINRVIDIIQEARKWDFDGLMVEAHPNPKEALTDKKQQLSFSQLANLLQ